MDGAQVISFRRNIAAATSDFEERTVVVDGAVSRVHMSFPSGPQFLMRVRLVVRRSGDENTRLVVPSDDDTYVALDGADIDFVDLSVPVARGDTLVAEWYNYDAANAHQVPVLVTVTPSSLGED